MGRRSSKERLERLKEKLKKEGKKLDPKKAEELATETTIDMKKLEEVSKETEKVLGIENPEELSEEERKAKVQQRLAETVGNSSKAGQNKYTRVKLAEKRLKDLLKKKGTVGTEELMGIELEMERSTPQSKYSQKVKKGSKERVGAGFEEIMEAISNLKNVDTRKKRDLYRKLKGASKEMESLVKDVSKYELQEGYDAVGKDKEVNEKVLESHKKGSIEALEEAREKAQEKIEKKERGQKKIEKRGTKQEKTPKMDEQEKKRRKFEKKLGERLSDLENAVENFEKGVWGDEKIQNIKKDINELIVESEQPLKKEQIDNIENALRDKKERKIFLAGLASDIKKKREITDEVKEKIKKDAEEYADHILD